MLCGQPVEVDDDAPLAKRAREAGPAFAYLCRACEQDILDRYGRAGANVNPALGDDRRFRRVFS